ncbi:MAG TPA: TetR/AcrR family transcriptional regulator [Limnobacter sp.]|nr:TetR/AcrR family transcriptional regulator [Limnobacter sp.]
MVEEQADGRRDRGARNKQLIVNAFLDYIREGNLNPTAQQVSERAGVGLRTVFRHFQDMETLYREMAHAVDAIIAPVLQTPLEGRTWQDKLHHAIDRRSAMFEQLMPIHVSSLAHLHASPFLKEKHERSVALQRLLLQGFLPKKVQNRKGTFEALDLVLSLDTWTRLRRDQDLTAEQAKKTIRHMVEKLIDGI